MRWLRHAWYGLVGVQNAFPAQVRSQIEQEIGAVEAAYQGEICFAVEAALGIEQLWQRTSARARAIQCFATLRVWDTALNNGVLIYVLLADKSVEIVADRALAARVGEDKWRSLCAAIEAQYGRGEYDSGSRQAIRGVAEHLTRHFPNESAGGNELPNQPVLL